MCLSYLKIIILGFLFNVLFNQQKIETFFIIEKGVYVKLKQGDSKIKVPYKKGISFYFSIKNDSTVYIQEIENKKLKQLEEYKLAISYDTAYLRRHTFDSIGNSKIVLEKIIYRKVFKK